jgi:AcrR family transcriptional regulator
MALLQVSSLSGQDPVGTHVNETRSTRCVSCTDAIPHADQRRAASQGHPDVAVERGGGDLVGFAEPPPAKKRSEARERLLAAASRLFYAEGINSVGIERIIKEGQVTLATFYRHFPSKVHLVVAYLHGTHDHIAARATEQAEAL